jgi:dihydroorotase-like cyclic amidohydrolase
MAAALFSGGYMPPLSPELAEIIFRPDNEEMRFMIDIALEHLLLDEESLREPPLSQASLQEPPLREASLDMSFLDENYVYYY